MKLHNISPGVNIKFRGFRGQRPAQAIFTVERYTDGFFGIAGLVSVPLDARPRSADAARRALCWAQRQVERELGGAV